MNLELRYQRPPSYIGQSSLESYRERPINPIDGRSIPSTYGVVKKVYDDCTVDVRISNGAIIPRVPVSSMDHYIVTVEADKKTYGTKRLPPVGSRVIVDFMDGSRDNPVVRGSVFSRVEREDQKNILEEGKATIDTTITQDGYRETRDQETGEYLLEDLDIPDFHIKVSKADQEIELVDWSGNKVTVNPDGISLEDASGNTVVMAGSLVEVNGNSKEVVTHAELTQALSTFWTQVVTALTTTPIAGNGSPQPAWTGLPTSIDISSAKSAKVKVG